MGQPLKGKKKLRRKARNYRKENRVLRKSGRKK